jgi:SET domain
LYRVQPSQPTNQNARFGFKKKIPQQDPIIPVSKNDADVLLLNLTTVLHRLATELQYNTSIRPALTIMQKVSLLIAAIVCLHGEGFAFLKQTPHHQYLSIASLGVATTNHFLPRRATPLLSAATSVVHTSKPSSGRPTSVLQESSSLQDPTVQAQKWQELYKRVAGTAADGAAADLLRLQHNNEGYRGVHLNRNVVAGEAVLSIPLSVCLRDDQPPPDWWGASEAQDESSSSAYKNFSDWATRLGACLLDQQIKLHDNEDSSDSTVTALLWLSLLPDSTFLRASLPVHWTEDIVKSAASTALELAVDRAYFARAAAVQELMDGLDITLEATTAPTIDERRSLCENALDLVQTRSCRVVLDNGGDECSQPLRLLAPVFDFINHSTGPNSVFALQDEMLVVTALRDLKADEEVLIDYGGSARPAWKCLSSYGFVPAFHATDSVSDNEGEEHIAEVFIDGFRYEVGPTTIPEDMVAAIAAQDQESNTATVVDVELTPEIAIRLGSRISDVAFNMLLDPWENNEETRSMDEDIADEDEDTQTADEILSSTLAASLRFNQHRILLACSTGLREWAFMQLSADV